MVYTLKVEGIIPAMITPFDHHERINEEAIRVMVNRFIAAGVHGLFCLGTNGEFFSLSMEEKVRISAIVIEEAAGRLPVYVGAGCTTTAETIQLARQLEAEGADALSIITPYFLSYTQQELLYHYQSIAEATALPIVLYNIPARTGNALQPGTVAKLAEIDTIVGIKDSSGSFDTILQYLERTPSSFSVMAGTDSLILATLMAGGSGAIASTANIFPEKVADIYRCWEKEDYKGAEEAQRVLRALRDSFPLGTLPSVIKALLNKMGLPAGPARRPVLALTPEAEQQVQLVYEQYVKQGLL